MPAVAGPRTVALACLCMALPAVAGCKGKGKLGLNSKDGLTASASAGGDDAHAAARGRRADPKGTGDIRCDATQPQRSSTELDTNGNGIFNVRKVYRVLGEGATTHSTLICREADVNNDGAKDQVRLYDNDGKALREDSDRNFDGKMDLAVVFQDGVVVTKEFDDDYDGKLDGKTFYEAGKPVRTELDLQGHSTPGNWRPTQWQYYEGGEIVRMGTDFNGDNRIDRWDRDQTKDEKVADGEGGSPGEEGEADGEADGDGDGDGDEQAEG